MIGVFDSGLGGLTVLQAFLKDKRLVKYDFCYLGDSARAPYGSKSPEVIYDYTVQAVDFLCRQGCELIIIACNTASAEALRHIQQEWLPQHYPLRRILGVVIPVAETAALLKADQVGIIGTRTTIKSRVYNRELSKISRKIRVVSQACPLLVPLIEEGWEKAPETLSVLRKYLQPLRAARIKVLILGCTHYPFLHDRIKRIMGKGCQVLDSPAIVASRLNDYLVRHPEIAEKISRKSRCRYFTTDDPARFRSLGERFLGKRIKDIKKIIL